ncbi:response regulator [Paenibacillus albiflavus]|uniref:Response regulator n=1 Tax=Paenibacillus albiflavus TaxID=2545760 RepID=A0A4V2WNS8_9BACL|nr:response regulator [Paenibacillus albiflavus]
MRAIVVDDEWLALQKMKKLLEEQISSDYSLELVGGYQDSYSAIETASKETLDLAFIDIEMPELDGFELAERLLDVQPNLRIIFVTAYHEYAVKAFEVNALDYIMKPVHHDRLTKTLQRMIDSGNTGIAANKGTNRTMLCCLQNLHYVDQCGDTQPFPWKTLKAPELFAYLVHYRDKTVSKQSLIDLLWPDYDTEKATTQLHTAIYQIRKIIKTAGFDLEIKYKDEGYRLIWGEMRLDAEEWENSVRQLPPISSESVEKYQSIMVSYTGDFLEEHRYQWIEYEQERLRLIWLDPVKQLAEYYASLGQYTDAILLYQQIRERLPFAEDGYFGLMRVYDKLNYQLEVRKQYQLISDILQEEFDGEPSQELTEWYLEWSKGPN